MKEQSAQIGTISMTRMRKLRGWAARPSSQLLIAFICGVLLGVATWSLLLGLLDPNSSASQQSWAWLGYENTFYLALVFPAGLGVVAAFITASRRKYPLSLALGTGLIMWLGMFASWFLFACYASIGWAQEAAEDCKRVNNHGYCGLHLEMLALFVYLLYGVILIILCSVITGLLIKLVTKLFTSLRGRLT